MQSLLSGESSGEGERKTGAQTAMVWALVAVWAAAVVVAGALGAFVGIAPPVIPAVVLGANALLVGGYRSSERFRAAVDGIDTRWLLWFQALRAPIGASFVYYGALRVLPERWASHAGWGDLVVGVGAAVLALSAGESSRARVTRTAWGVLGLVDILTVVVHAQYVALVERDARFVAMVGRLPFIVIPMFIVPLVFATHALLFARDRDARRAPRG
ncbi:MAG: hypothetical protein JNK05_23155 [Myxococcales bacterium]|nr:hypothetical protein [Myxococcales bacterium]